VVNRDGFKIGLSMKDVDQVTGKEISEMEPVKHRKILKGPPILNRPFGLITGISTKVEEQKRRPQNQITAADLWEMSRLKAMAPKEAQMLYPDYKPESDHDEDDEVEIEINEMEAPFLHDQTTKGGVHLSPIKVVMVPEGTLQREALNAV